MGLFAALTLGLILAMGWYTKSVSHEIQRGMTPSPNRKKSVHETLNTEGIALGALQFTMWVLGYGVARMICQPWMWELHFWPVLALTIVAVISACLFVWLVSPAIPSFCAVMAMPPYVDHYNLKMMTRVATYAKMKSTDPKSPRAA